MFDRFLPRLALCWKFLLWFILLPVLYENQVGYQCFVSFLTLFPGFKLETKDPLYYNFPWPGSGKINLWSCLLSMAEKKRNSENFYNL